MSEQLDKFFREKLEIHKRPAPSDAWKRIEAGLSKKNDGKLWLKIAASVLLIAAATFGIRTIIGNTDSTLITKENTGNPSKETHNGSPGQTKNLPSSVDPLSSLPAESKNDNQEAEPFDNTKTTMPTITINDKIEIPAIDNDSLATSDVVKHLANSEETALTDTAEETQRAGTNSNFKLVIEADEVNAKYLNKKYLSKATSKADSTSGIKKLLVKAQDLKNNQDPFGDLRQMKNEILALNFQGNKKQEQNK